MKQQNSGRTRNYDDEIQCYDYEPPKNAPEWAFVKQPDDIYDTNPNTEEDDDDTETRSNKSNVATDTE